MRTVLKIVVALMPFMLMAPSVRAAPREAPRPADKGERMKIQIPKQSRSYQEQTPKAQKEQGRNLFKQGNQMFERRQLDTAIKLYRRAFKLWPHPRVLFNIAVTLGFMSRPLESARTFKQVLEYGPDPITPHRYKQAVERYIELMGQLTTLVVSCQDAGAKLFIDGRSIGTAPIEKKVTLGPGTHMVTASLEGKVPYSAQIRLAPGELKRINVGMQAFSDAVRFRSVSRFHWAIPTSVTAGAAALAAVGLGLLMQGRSDVGDIQDQVNQTIQIQGTSVPFIYDTNKESRALGLQKGGWALIGTAAATAVAGLVLWLVRKKRVRYTVGSTTEGGNVKIRF